MVTRSNPYDDIARLVTMKERTANSAVALLENYHSGSCAMFGCSSDLKHRRCPLARTIGAIRDAIYTSKENR